MKKALWLVVVLALAALAVVAVVVWKPQGRTPSEPAPAKLEFNYTYDKRDVFFEDAGADLSGFDQGIKELSERAATGGTNVQANAHVKIEDLRNRRTTLSQKLEALKHAREANWDDLKSDFQKSEDNLKTSFRDVSQWLTAQIHGRRDNPSSTNTNPMGGG